MTLTAIWFDGRREPKQAPDPRYPDGIDLDYARAGAPSCSIELEHPTKRCGLYIISCDVCGHRVFVTTAGRADDPRSVRLPCRGN